MRVSRGVNGLALQGQQALALDPHGGDFYVFRDRRGGLVKTLWHDGLGTSLYAERLERGRFIWHTPAVGSVAISASQLAYLLEGYRLAASAADLAPGIGRLRAHKHPFACSTCGVIDAADPIPKELEALRAARVAERAASGSRPARAGWTPCSRVSSC